MGKAGMIFKNRPIIIIVFVAFVLRIVMINQSLWLDEAIGAIAVKKFSYSGILTDFIRSDNHTPLYYLALKAWTNIFGYSELAVRLPSVIFGALSVYVVYLIGLEISKKDKNIAYYAAVLMTVSQFHVYYSQEARMYMMACFFTTIAVYSYLKTFTSKEKKYWIAFSFALVLLVFSDYVPVYMLPVFWIYPVVIKVKKGWWKSFIIFHVPLLTTGILWFPTFLYQSSRGRWLLDTLPSWKTVAGGATFKQAALVWMKFVFGRISLVNKDLYYILVVAASVPVVFLLYKSTINTRNSIKFVWIWLVVPLVMVFLSSFMFPAFIYFRFTFLIPAFYLLLAWGLSKIDTKNVRNFIFGMLIVLGLVGVVIYYTDHMQQREQWKQAVNFIEGHAGEDDVAIFEFPDPFAPYLWYETGKVESKGATDSISANKEGTKDKTREIVKGKNGIYHFNYLRDITDPQRYVETELGDLGYLPAEEFGDFWGVGMITYWIKQ